MSAVNVAVSAQLARSDVLLITQEPAAEQLVDLSHLENTPEVAPEVSESQPLVLDLSHQAAPENIDPGSESLEAAPESLEFVHESSKDDDEDIEVEIVYEKIDDNEDYDPESDDEDRAFIADDRIEKIEYDPAKPDPINIVETAVVIDGKRRSTRRVKAPERYVHPDEAKLVADYVNGKSKEAKEEAKELECDSESENDDDDDDDDEEEEDEEEEATSDDNFDPDATESESSEDDESEYDDTEVTESESESESDDDEDYVPVHKRRKID